MNKNVPRMTPSKWFIKRTNGETEFVEKKTYIPAHEREECVPVFESDDLDAILEEIEDKLVEGGAEAAFDEIKKLRKMNDQL